MKKMASKTATIPRITIQQPASAPRVDNAKKRNNLKQSNNAALKGAMAALAGGAAGALVGGLLVRAGVSPKVAAVGCTVAGVVGTVTLKGTPRMAAAGSAATGAGQMALAWLASKRPATPAPAAAPVAAAAPRQIAAAPRKGLPEDVAEAFAAARRQMAESTFEGVR